MGPSQLSEGWGCPGARVAWWGAPGQGSRGRSVETLGDRGAEIPTEPRARTGFSVGQVSIAQPQGQGQGSGDVAVLP